MKFRRMLALSLICTMMFLIIPGFSFAAEEDGDRKEEPVRKVLKHLFLITIEGVSSKDLLAAYTPNINGVAAGGVRGEAIGVLPADTASFLGALLNGNNPDTTDKMNELKISLPGVLDSNGKNAVIVDDGKGDFPEILKGIKRIKPEKPVGYKNADKTIVDLAIRHFNEQRPFFTAIVLPGTKYARAEHEASSKNAIVVTNQADEQIGRLLRELRSQGIYENSLVVITGSTLKETGERSNLNLEKMMVPVIMAGPGIKAGVSVPPIRIVDVAPTLAMLSGVSLGRDIDGLVLWDVLEPGQGFSEGNLMQKRVKELSNAHLEEIKGSYRLLNDKININIQKEQVNKEKREIENRIREKQQEIDKLNLKLNVFKGVAIVFIVVAAAGYILQYFILRKKFLMF